MAGWLDRLRQAVSPRQPAEAPPAASAPPPPEPSGWQRREELLSKAPALRPAVQELEAPPVGWQARRGRAKPMGIQPGVTDATGRAYKDSEAEATFTELGPEQRYLASSGNRSLICVFGRGSGSIDGKAVHAGQVLALQPGQEETLKAGKDGLEVFAARLSSPLGDAAPVQVLDRLALGPFEEEQIIVAPGTPHAFDGKFNVAEVIIPPGVTTSEHDLTVNERYLVLEGSGTMFLDGKEHPVGKGSVVHIPSRTAQAIRNDSDEPMRFYCLCTPPFTPDSFAPGKHHGTHPEGFNLAEWWAANSARFG